MAKDQFNQQIATFKLREPINEGRVMFTIDDEEVDQLFNKKYEEDVDYIHDGPDVYYITDQNDLQKFVDYVESMGLDANRIHVHEYFKEDMGGTVTSGGEAYLPALNVPSKKQNPFKEGKQEYFIQVDVRDAKTALAIIDDSYSLSNTIKKRGTDVYTTYDVMAAEELVDSLKQNGIKSKNNVEGYVDEDVLSGYTQDKSYRPGHTKDTGGFQYKDLWGINEARIPDNVMSFAKRKGVTALVNKVAGWAQKAGKRIVGGTAIGKGYNTLILDLTYQGGEIRINLEEETISVNGEDYIYDYDEFKNALGPINENYSRFKNETKSRKNPEQFHQAVKSVKRKVEEIHKLYEYMERLKLELSESSDGLKYKKYTESAIFKIKEAVKALHEKTKRLK